MNLAPFNWGSKVLFTPPRVHALQWILGFARARYLNRPERYVVEAAREGDDVGRDGHLVLLVPGAGEQLLRGDSLEHWQVQQGQLASQVLGGDI